MTKEEFYTFIDGLKITPYGDWYITKIMHHIDKAPLQHKININSYFKEGTTDRIKFINAIKYIDAASLLKGKRIDFDGNESFTIDSIIEYKIKET